MRLPVAAKIALQSAGATTAPGGSPQPNQKPPLGTKTELSTCIAMLDGLTAVPGSIATTMRSMRASPSSPTDASHTPAQQSAAALIGISRAVAPVLRSISCDERL